jgi:hypothetical protein
VAGRAQSINGDIEGSGHAAVGWPWRVLAAVDTGRAPPGSAAPKDLQRPVAHRD